MKNILLTFIVCLLCISCNNNTSNKPSLSENESGKFVEHQLILDEKKDTLTFTWSEDLCSYRGYYLDGIYNTKQLENTLNLWRKVYYGVNSDNTIINYPKDYSKLDYSGMTKDYDNLITQLKDTSKIISNSYWQNFFQGQIKNITIQYELLCLRAESYFTPSILIESKYTNSDDDCYKYAKALVSADSVLYNEWEKLTLELKQNNGAPDMLIQNFYEEYNSADKRKYAFINLINYGWWNCVNHNVIVHPDYNVLSDKFQELFFKVEVYDCEEP